MYILLFSSLSLATSERGSYRGCSLKVVLKSFVKLTGCFFICFCFIYRVIKIIQIVLTLTKFVLYVCWLKSCYLVFVFESKKEKKREKSSECFSHGSRKMRVFNQVPSKMSWETKLKFSSTFLIIIFSII